jgi:hypothetical protein
MSPRGVLVLVDLFAMAPPTLATTAIARRLMDRPFG